MNNRDNKKHPNARDRAAWFKWQSTHHASVAETCRHFEIARCTWYRWQQRYDPHHPVQSLRSRRGRPRARLAPQEALFFVKVIDLSVEHPTWGRGLLRESLRALRDDAPSEATIGRWLRKIRRRCPVCRASGGSHNVGRHLFRRDLTMLGLAPRVRPPTEPPPFSGPQAVRSAERIIRQARRPRNRPRDQ